MNSMRLSMSLLAATVVFGGLAAPQLAFAAPPRVPPGECNAVTAKVGQPKVWQAVFWAERQDDFGHVERTLSAPCFTTQATCKAWLYWQQTDWPESGQLSVRYCKIGRPYG
jgi:hypothetical protein